MKAKLFLLVLIGGFVVSCKNEPRNDDPPPYRIVGEKIIIGIDSPQLTSIHVEPVESHRGTVVHLTGRLVWNEDVTVRIFSPFAGRVRRVYASVSQSVKPGTPLVEIESPDFAQAQTDAHRAETDFQLAERNLTRARDLFSNGAAAQKDVSSAEAEYSRAKSEKERTTARLASYGGSGAMINGAFILKSPISGVVAEKNINPGQEIRPDQMLSNAAALFVVTDPTKLWLQLDASERDLEALKPGVKLTVHTQAYSDADFPGRLDLVSDMLDPTTRTVKVRGSIENPEHRLKAEMYVSVDLIRDDLNEISISKGAVLFKNERHYVFVETGAGQFSQQEIKIGTEHDGSISVREGLQPGQSVVTEGSLLLEQWLQSQSVENS
jgi:RND family efflux transporter, MFP subunit